MPSAAAGARALRTQHTVWRPSHRLVPSRFPPVGLFDHVADAKDLEAVYALEAMTNDRLREEAGDLHLVPVKDRITGPGSTPIMAAFTHLNAEGSRFSDGSYGVYYCARTLDTALAEVRYHQERFLRRTGEGPIRLELRLYLSNLDAKLIDVRKRPECHIPDDYAPGQRLGRVWREAGKDGVLYRSVRHEGGLCAAVFRPPALGACIQSTHYAFHFDGTRIVAIDGLSTAWTARP
jgi:RES domain